MMRPGLIYAEISNDGKYACGYYHWYMDNYQAMSTLMFSRQYNPEMLLQIKERLSKQGWHYAARIRKTHCHCIPVHVMICKMRKFLREQADIIINNETTTQLEFDFMKGK